MNDYIKRSDVLEAFSNLQPSGFEHSLAGIVAINTVKAVPAADVVEVVRCKDCKRLVSAKYNDGWGENSTDYYCEKNNYMEWHGNRLDYFCADGERREVSE